MARPKSSRIRPTGQDFYVSRKIDRGKDANFIQDAERDHTDSFTNVDSCELNVNRHPDKRFLDRPFGHSDADTFNPGSRSSCGWATSITARISGRKCRRVKSDHESEFPGLGRSTLAVLRLNLLHRLGSRDEAVLNKKDLK